MPLAKEVAAEFRRLADCLDKEPDVEVKRPIVAFYSNERKETFLNAARLFPRPLKKSEQGTEIFPSIRIEHKTAAAWIYAEVYKSATCTLIEPAKPAVYKCEPLLSDAQIEEIGSEVA